MSQEAGRSLEVPCATGTDRGDEVDAVDAFSTQRLPDFEGDFFAGAALPELSPVVVGNRRERDTVRTEDLQSVEDGSLQVFTSG